MLAVMASGDSNIFLLGPHFCICWCLNVLQVQKVFRKWLSGHTEASSFLFFANDISAQVSEIIMERISAEKDLVVKE